MLQFEYLLNTSPRNVAVWQIIHMETIILNTMACVLGRIDPNMVLSSVQHMGHTKALEVGNVTHRLSIPNDDAWKHLDKGEVFSVARGQKRLGINL